MTDKLRAWSRENWNKLSESVRKDCVDHLDGWISPEIIKEWKANDYDTIMFHLSSGMRIRNRLRDKLRDDHLPIVIRDPDDKLYGPSRNWDDYYTGAIDELLERYNDDGSKK